MEYSVPAEKSSMGGQATPEIIRRAFLSRRRSELYVAQVPRPPVLCAGCTTGAYEVGKYKDVVVTETSAATPWNSASFECYRLCHLYGSQRFRRCGVQQGGKHGQKEKVFAVIGDSTFFHSGNNGSDRCCHRLFIVINAMTIG